MNKNDKAIFEELMDKYLSDTIGPEERALLFKMIRKGESVPLLDKYMETGFDVSAGMEASPEWEAAFDARLLARIRHKTRENSRVPFPIRPIRMMIRYAAAILLLLVMSGVFYFLRKGHHINSQVIAKGSENITPGHNGAILTLSNGHNILLDSAGNGLVATQGKTEIHKEDGRITYTGNDNKELVYNSITTARGRQWSLVLPDGSKVRLNAASTLKYPAAFAGKQREVELKGEAYFEVAENKEQPFIVKVNNTEVKVLGTHFDIMAYEEEPALTTTLLEGSVAVSSNAQSRTLRPGQQACIDQQTQQTPIGQPTRTSQQNSINQQTNTSQPANTGQPTRTNQNAPIAIINNADIERTMAWTTGFFKFDHTDLRTMMREISRWYDVDVVYETELKESDTYSGRVSRNLAIADLITFLEGNKVHHFRTNGKKVIVLP